MYALLARVLGPLLSNPNIRRAATELASKYGMKFVKNFIKDVGSDGLKNLSKQEIIDLASTRFTEQSGKLFNDKLFSRSNAKKLGALGNKGIDQIEKLTTQWVRKQALGARASQLGIELEESPFARIGLRSERVNRTVDQTLGLLILPTSQKQAFAGGYLRGLAGESLARAVNRAIIVLTGAPRTAINTPKFRAFLRTLTRELRGVSAQLDVRTAQKLWTAIQRAKREASAIQGQPAHMLKYSAIGNVSGRVTVAAGAEYVFVDEDERKANIQRFKNSIAPFAKKKVKTYVNAYKRDDGTKVKGHYRTLEVAA